MKRYTWLITGGGGFIGAATARALIKQKQQVVIYDNFSSSSRASISDIKDKARIIKGDVLDFKKLARACKGADFALHFAAFVSVPLSAENPEEATAVNAGGTLNMLRAAVKCGVRKVLLSSSAAVYASGAAARKETSVLAPASPYAQSKLLAEELCRMFYKTEGLQTVVLRYFNVYGPGQDARSPYNAVLPAFAARAKKGLPVTIYGDGRQTRDFVFVQDVVQANILAALKAQNGEVYNVASGAGVSVLEAADMLEKITKRKVKRVFAPARAGDIAHSRADISKIKKLGFRPKVGLRRGLADVLEQA